MNTKKKLQMNFYIQTIPAFKDNYIWLIQHPTLPEAIVVDPGDGGLVLEQLKIQHIRLTAILLTHKHQDHIGGVRDLLRYFDVPVFGNQTEKIPEVTHFIDDTDKISLLNWPSIQVISVPGHTLGHVAYFFVGRLFCGDTLFGGGCGRLFEGTPIQMLHSLSKIKAFPDGTLIYCAHEYTLQNLNFAKQVEPGNLRIQERITLTLKLRQEDNPSVPSTLLLEKETNPFLRCDQPAVQHTVAAFAKQNLLNEVDVFKYLREWRNQY